MSEAFGNRRNPRMPTRFAIQFSSQRQEGKGVLANISYTGARVEETGIRPSIGALAILYVCLPDDLKPFQLEGKVARHTHAGFAIEYEKPDQDTRRGVDRIAEMVGLPEASPSNSSGSTPIESVEDDPSVTRPRRPEMPQLSQLDLTDCEVSELEMLAERIASELTHRRDDSKRRVREEIEKLVAREGFSLEEVL